MKANLIFCDDIFADVDYKVTVYGDSKAEIFRVVDALGKKFVVTNCYIKDEEKKEN